MGQVGTDSGSYHSPEVRRRKQLCRGHFFGEPIPRRQGTNDTDAFGFGIIVPLHNSDDLTQGFVEGGRLLDQFLVRRFRYRPYLGECFSRFFSDDRLLCVTHELKALKRRQMWKGSEPCITACHQHTCSSRPYLENLISKSRAPNHLGEVLQLGGEMEKDLSDCRKTKRSSTGARNIGSCVMSQSPLIGRPLPRPPHLESACRSKE